MPPPRAGYHLLLMPVRPRRGHDVVVVGASAGGVEALARLVAELPDDLPAAVLVVLHVPADSPSSLPRILGRVTKLDVAHAVDGEPIRPGRISVAPPDAHLLVGPTGRLEVTRGPRENGHRPAIDPLFRSAAAAFGARTVGVVLSGAGSDGAAGLLAVKRHGGVALVQSPDEALHTSMPRRAIELVDVDAVLDLVALAGRIDVESRTGGVDTTDGDDVDDAGDDGREAVEIGAAALAPEGIGGDDRPGSPSAYSCPECSGVLWELHEAGSLRFRCRVGHAYSPESLEAEQTAVVEDALWTALRALDERTGLAQRLAERARERGHRHSAEHFEDTVHEARHAGAVIRAMLDTQPTLQEAADAAERDGATSASTGG